MNYSVEVNNKTKIEKVKKMLLKLNLKFLKSQEKVAYYYEDITTHISFSFNKNMTFYSASSIKILVALYLYLNAENDLDKTLKIKKEDIKQGTGILKDKKEKSYTIRELIKYSLIYSDNTAYIKLVNYVGKDKLKEFGLSLGATYTMQGKENDSFGIINCSDMIIYWKKLKEYIDSGKYGNELKSFLIDPSYKIIDLKNIGNNEFVRKYGGFDEAFHEAGIVYGEHPFYLIILTQKFKLKNKEKFINMAAKKIYKIHKEVYKEVKNG